MSKKYVTNFDILDETGKIQNVIVQDPTAYVNISQVDPTNIIIIGDSITVGYTPSGTVQSWARKLIDSVSYENSYIVAESGIGFTTDQESTGRTILDLWNSEKTKIEFLSSTTCVIIMLGVNDRAGISELYSKAVTFFRQVSSDCPNAKIIYTFDPTSGFFPISMFTNVYFAARDANIIPIHAQHALIGQFSLFADSLHPTENGQTRIKNIMLEFLNGFTYKNFWSTGNLGTDGNEIRLYGIDDTVLMYVNATIDSAWSTKIGTLPKNLDRGFTYYGTTLPAYIDVVGGTNRRVCNILVNSPSDRYGIYVLQDINDTVSGNIQQWFTFNAYTCLGSV